MNAKEIIKTAWKGIVNHKVGILIGSAAAGFITAGIFAVKQTPKALEHIEEKKKELNKEKLTVKETVQACWRDYIWPVGIGVAASGASITAAVFAEKDHKALGGALTALAISEKTIDELHEATKEVVGKTKASDIDAKVTEKHVQEDIKNGINSYPALEPGQLWFRDRFTGQSFVSTYERLEKAIAKANELSAFNMCVSVTELYDEYQQIEIGNRVAIPDMDDIVWPGKIAYRLSPINIWDKEGNLVGVVNEIIYDFKPTTREQADCFR